MMDLGELWRLYVDQCVEKKEQPGSFFSFRRELLIRTKLQILNDCSRAKKAIVCNMKAIRGFLSTKLYPRTPKKDPLLHVPKEPMIFPNFHNSTHLSRKRKKFALLLWI